MEVTGGECEVRSPGGTGWAQSPHCLREVARAGPSRCHMGANAQWQSPGGIVMGREP